MNLFINLLFGHLVGDFFIQPKTMAVKKGASNWIAFVHVTLYTLAIACFTTFAWRWLLFVFITHFIVDRWSLADKWLQLIKGRDLPGFVFYGHKDIPNFTKMIEDEDHKLHLERYFEAQKYKSLPKQKLKAENQARQRNYLILRGGFSSIVYTVVDNTIHLMSMYYAYPFLVK